MLFHQLFAAATEKSSVGEVFNQGGIVLIVLLLLSVLLMALAMFMFFTLKEDIIAPKSFLTEAEALTDKGDMESLYELSRQSTSPVAAVVGAAAEQMHNDDESSYDMLKDAAESEGSHQAGVIYHRLSYVSDIAKIAPMIGLLGTVIGMMNAFSGLKQDFGGVKPIALADGIAQAMVTTAAGLIVGLVAMFFHSILRQRAARLVDLLEQKSAKVLRRFMKKA